MGRTSVSLVVVAVVGVVGFAVEGCSSGGRSGGAPLATTSASSPSPSPSPASSPSPSPSPIASPAPSSSPSPTSSSPPEPTYVTLVASGGVDTFAEGPSDPGLSAAVSAIQSSFPAQPAGASRYVGFSPSGLLCPLNLTPADLEGRVTQALDIAEQTGMPVFFHLDDHLFWWRATNVNQDPANVEWSAFPAPGAAIGTPLPPRFWLDWGNWLVFPAGNPCFDSPAFRAFWASQLRDHFASLVVARLASWSASGRGYLFAGVGIGNETQLFDMSYLRGTSPLPQGQDQTVSPAVNETMGPDDTVATGYNSLTIRGYDAAKVAALASSSGTTVQQVTESLLDVVAHDYADFGASVLTTSGIPLEKVYTHFTSPVRASMVQGNLSLYGSSPPWTGNGNVAPPFAASVNTHSRPGYTVVRDSVDLADLTSEIAAARNGSGLSDQGWAAVESYVTTSQPGVPQTQAQYEAYLGGMLGHGARLVNVYGWGVQGSPYFVQGSGAVATIQEWLSGQALPAGWTKD